MKTPAIDFDHVTPRLRTANAVHGECNRFATAFKRCFSGLKLFRNSNLAVNDAAAETTAEEIAFGTAINVAPIDNADDEWNQISPYGEFPNEEGLQIVNREYAEQIVAAFNSVLAKLGRLFRGIPVYRGHPDVRPDIWPDDKRYGRYNALEARNDGLYGKPAWNDIGTQNVEQGYYVYPSPAWYFKKLGNGKIAPIRLKSVGLTNDPNIFESVPVTKNAKLSAAPAKSEQQKKESTNNIMERAQLIAALGLKAEATDADILAAINIATNAETNPLVIAANSAKTKAEGDLATAINDAKKFKKAAVDHELTLAINDKRITAAELPAWGTKFDEDFDKAQKELKEKAPATNAQLPKLAPSGADLSDASKRRIAYNARVDHYLRNGCRSIDEAIAAMRADPEDAALLAAMDPKPEEKKAA